MPFLLLPTMTAGMVDNSIHQPNHSLNTLYVSAGRSYCYYPSTSTATRLQPLPGSSNLAHEVWVCGEAGACEVRGRRHEPRPRQPPPPPPCKLQALPCGFRACMQGACELVGRLGGAHGCLWHTQHSPAQPGCSMRATGRFCGGRPAAGRV